jgi:hypothetical protein
MNFINTVNTRPSFMIRERSDVGRVVTDELSTTQPSSGKRIYWHPMSRRFWIGFYAFALSLLVCLFLLSLIICINGLITHLWFECITAVLIPYFVWLSWITLGLLRRTVRERAVDDNSAELIDAGTNDRIHKAEPNPSRYGEWRATALVVLVLAAFVALIWTIHRSGMLVVAFIVLFCISAPFGKKLIGQAECVQIASSTLERRLQSRYRTEFNQLAQVGFKPLFIFGESTSLYRLVLIYPIVLYTIMLLNREIATVKGSRLVFGYAVLNSNDGKTYVYLMQLGLKFYTRFKDGTILLTKSFGGTTKYGSNVILQRLCDASIHDVWMEHNTRVQQLEADGKQVEDEISFATFYRIWAES